MKSKISFFNKTIFLKNLKLFWPIWLGYTLLLFAYIPCRLFLEFKHSASSAIIYGADYKEEYLKSILNSIDMQSHILFIVIMVIISAVAVFSYLNNSRSANMIHAFPVNRMELYCTNTLSALSFMWGPQIITFVVSLLVCLGYGETRVIYYAVWLVMSLAISFFLLSVAIISVMCTGHILAVPVIFFIFNYCYIVIRAAFANAIQYFAYGVQGVGDWSNGNLNWLSPLTFIYKNVFFEYTRDENLEHIVGLDFKGVGVISVYFTVGLAFFTIAYLLYKLRNIECAGDVITFSKVRPVFRWGIGITAGLIGSWLGMEVLSQTGYRIDEIWFLVFALLIGIIVFWCTDMIIQKNFKVIKRKRIRECGIYIAVFVLVLFSVKFGGNYIENIMPDSSEVESAFIYSNYPVKAEGDKIYDVMAIQKEILSNKNYFKKVKSTADTSIKFKYILKDKSVIERVYSVPFTDKSINSILGQVFKLESNEDNFKKAVMCYDIDKFYIDPTIGNLEVVYVKDERSGAISLNPKQIKALIVAMEKDIAEGNLQKFYYQDPSTVPMKKYDDGTYVIDESIDREYIYWLSFDFVCNDFSDYKDSYIDMYGEDNAGIIDGYDGFEYYGENTSFYNQRLSKDFRFDENCTNILNALIDSGVVDSIDSLHRVAKSKE